MRFQASGRVAHLLILHLPVAVERRERPRLAGVPVVIAGTRSVSKVLDCSSEALREGVRPGMALRQAEQLCPEAIFLPPRLDLYQTTSTILFELLSSRLPVVELAQPGAAYLGLDSLESDDKEALALCHQQGQAIAAELRLKATVGVATNKFTAEAASLSIGPNRALVLARGTERSFLSDFPVAVLPVSDHIREHLRLFGLRRLDQFARLPPAAVLAQFGWEGQRAHSLARGLDDRPVVAGQRQRSETASLEFDPPLDDLETLIRAAGRLASALAERLAPAFLRAEQLDLKVSCVDSSRLTAQRLLSEPTADAGHLARLAERLLRALSYSDRVSDLTFTLSGLRTPSLHQLSLWHNPGETAAVASERALLAADAHLARLTARYGPSCFRRAVLVAPGHRLAGRRFELTVYGGRQPPST